MIIIIIHWQFFESVLADGFLSSLSDSKSSHVYRTFLSILADLNNAVIWMVCTHPLISKSSSAFDSFVTHSLQLVKTSLSCSSVFSIP